MDDAAPKLVVLDRDGVVNVESDRYVKSPEEWQPIPGSLEAIADLCAHGFEVFVVSNQSGIGRGLLTEDALAAIHAKMREAVERVGGSLRGVYYCPHRPDEGCRCRKPAPGLLERVESESRCSLAGAPFIGDKLSDVAAARAVGARPILVRTGHGSAAARALATEPGTEGAVEVYADLAAAVRRLVAE